MRNLERGSRLQERFGEELRFSQLQPVRRLVRLLRDKARRRVHGKRSGRFGFL